MIATRLATVREAVAQAVAAAGRDPSSVKLVAVSKLQPIGALALAFAEGQRAFGENYAQELRDKAPQLPGAEWHFIGPLQRNKVKFVVGTAALVHTVDSPALAEELARRAAAAGVVQRCLIEVNLGHEAHKAGCSIASLSALVDLVAVREELALEGLMVIPPLGDAEVARPCFRRLRELAEAERRRTGLPLRELSMGMSGDFAVAIAEGATLVRVGAAIFGERPHRG